MFAIPPAQFQEAPALPARDVAIAGFNGQPLKGTVLPGRLETLFAVLVADSGPLDRDWSSPRLATSHAGRALAQWLQARGIGSLRCDKRMAGSRDPHLNTSLDAQGGDLRAILAAARKLPEARGRRLLLIGHGEGALLSLLAGTDADALLLLEMPGQCMARTLAEQLHPQLPPDRAPASLAYLEAVFQAIRDARPTPKAGPDVLPAMARFGVSLMAPETLDFVKATLDLDPWTMVARVPVPVALAWGDRDIQSWHPAQIPPGFHGAVLDLPGANHLLRREVRPRAELDGASALEAYGDDVPLADLKPIADWLETLSPAK